MRASLLKRDSERILFLVPLIFVLALILVLVLLSNKGLDKEQPNSPTAIIAEEPAADSGSRNSASVEARNVVRAGDERAAGDKGHPLLFDHPKRTQDL